MSLKDDNRLFKPIRFGRCELSSRIVMGPLGSTLADENNVLGDSAREYYGQRACVPGTLIIGEATFVSPQASGTTERRAGIYTEEQINSWKRIVHSVHEAGSFIYLQLWALGRSADPEVKARDGTGDVVSSSAVAQEGGPVPRALSEEEIWTYVEDYAEAARVAVEIARFDGVELHGGNNSLLDQFTQDVVNQRTDGWGGSIEKRSRFGIEVAAAVCAAIGSDRVGYRITPFSTYQSMGMKDAVPQFCDLLAGLKALGVHFVHLVESRIAGRVDVEAGESLDSFIEQWGDHGPIILAGGFGPESAATAVNTQYKDKDVLIAFGRAFVTNLDLVQKVKDGTPLAE